MEHSDIVLGLLGPPDEDSTKSVHPTMSAFHLPSPRFPMCLTLHLVRLFSFWRNMCREGKFLGEFLDLIVGIAFIETQILLFVRAGRGSFDWNALQGFFDHFHVGTVGPVHGHTQRDAVALDQQAAFGALLGAIGGVFACLFPPRGVPWSCIHPCSAIPSQYPSNSRTPAVRSSTAPGIRRRPPTPGSDRGRWTLGRTSSRLRPSTGTRCARRRKSRPCTPDRACVADHRQSDACSRAQAGGLRSPPRDHRGCATYRKRSQFSWSTLLMRATTQLDARCSCVQLL